jgi:hypothetical protein
MWKPDAKVLTGQCLWSRYQGCLLTGITYLRLFGHYGGLIQS